MAGNTWTDIFFPAFFQLGDVFAVAKHLSSDGYGVNLPLLNGFFRSVRLHSACDDDGDIHKPGDMLRFLQVAVERHVHRGMSPIPGIVGSVVTVQSVISRILQVFRGFFAFCQIPSDFRKLLTWNGSHLKVNGFRSHAVPEHDRIIVSAFLFNSFHHFNRKTIGVFEGAAVLVRPQIEQCDKKLLRRLIDALFLVYP